jgi:hypothetical protein
MRLIPIKNRGLRLHAKMLRSSMRLVADPGLQEIDRITLVLSDLSAGSF